jgi:hypothetical protein
MRSRRQLFALMPCSLLLSGCRTTHSPAVDILGSYFPAWIVCIISGLFLTILARQVFSALKLAAHLRPAPLVYLCLMISFTLAVWLIFFKN